MPLETIDATLMAWTDFTRPSHFWTVIRCAPGYDLTPDDILSFVGAGDGGRGSLLLTDTGVLWGARCLYLGGAGTDDDPYVVRLKRRGRRFTIRRCADRLACYRGNAAGPTEPIWTAEESG